MEYHILSKILLKIEEKIYWGKNNLRDEILKILLEHGCQLEHDRMVRDILAAGEK